jgi:1,4-alpha-glucan branching enzyme
MISNLFNRVPDSKGLLTKGPDTRRLAAMSDEHITSEPSAEPTFKWTVKNKIRQFVESGRHLIAPHTGLLRGSRKTRPDQRQMTFSLYAPAAGCVSLAGDFNAWRPDDCPLEKSPDGMWERVVTLPAGRHEYKFVVDGLWQNDPRCTVYAPNPFGGENCVVVLS